MELSIIFFILAVEGLKDIFIMKLIYFDNAEIIISPVDIRRVEFKDDPDSSGLGTVHLYKDNGEEVINRPYHDKKEKLDMFIDITRAMESVYNND